MAMAIPTSDPKADERALVEGLRRSDEGAYEQLVRQYGVAMLAVARRFLRDDDDAHDAVQDAMVAAFKAMRFFREDARLSTWLHRILVNACLMRLRTRSRRPEGAIDELLPAFYEDGHRIDPGPPWRSEGADLVEQRELATLVRGAIDRLPEIYRNVLLLRDIEGLDTEETARLLDVKGDTVKVRLHRARQALSLIHI